jgi:V/A-type H+-transporting ATPase subunit F
MAKEKYNIAIIGTKDQILGFKALGMTAVNANNADEAKEKLFELVKEEIDLGDGETRKKYAIIFVLEEYMVDLQKEDYKKLNKDALPAVVPIPGVKGTQGFGLTRIKRMVEQAVGSDIFG